MCHAVDAAKPDGLGPNLWGIYNGKAARRARFNYSLALKKSAIVWTDANLDRWLANPSTMVKGNRMLFAGIPRQPVRADIIAYLKTLK